ncbi:hypothetical protein [Amycolatopsis sp. 195334CR]|uniref:deazapurine DNA modification protein DpdA family protein n=1 Tax=Amycolatopsis sp. 195334CR TaxID=2814588 RepID=UPI001A8E6A4A|nr:hypothetical protein [Amycolatopsis sp. 195334CR]MBN6034115.1 hypothetical protein [Amycolatopsis sp. 195334CR]
MKFYLGTHQPAWLARDLGVPLLVSHRRLAGRRTLPRASGEWALDSGGFTELSLHGRWRTDARTYATAVGRYAAEIGRLAWAAPQDWMVEAHVRARTGLSLRTHLQRTVRNYLQLRELAPELPIIPIVQGDQVADYLRCADSYERHGVDLAALPLVGVGSVCRRQHSGQVERIVRSLHARGLRLHCFGVKTIGLARYGEVIQSSDSAAWSFSGRYQPGCTPSHRTEANCLTYALAWHHRLQRTLNSAPRHDHTRPDTPRRCSPGPGRSQPGGSRPSPHRTDTRVPAHRNRPAQRKVVRR